MSVWAQNEVRARKIPIKVTSAAVQQRLFSDDELPLPQRSPLQASQGALSTNPQKAIDLNRSMAQCINGITNEEKPPSPTSSLANEKPTEESSPAPSNEAGSDLEVQQLEPHHLHWLNNPRQAFLDWKSTSRKAYASPDKPAEDSAHDDARPDRARSFEQHSIEQYLAMWGKFLNWMTTYAPGVTVGNAQAAHIERFLSSLRGGRKGNKPPAASTERRYLFLLHRTFEHLRHLEVRKTNPCADFPELQSFHAQPRPPRKFLTNGQRTQFIQWCLAQDTLRWEQLRNCALRLTLLASGITVSEARSLRLQDIQLDMSAKDPDQRMWLMISEHGSSPPHSAPLDATAARALQTWLDTRATMAPKGDSIFNARRRDGMGLIHDCPAAAHAISAEELYGIVSEAFEGIGLDGARTGATTLRNTFMAHHIRCNTPLEKLRDWLGLRTTQQLQLLRAQIPHTTPQQTQDHEG